MNLSFWSKKLLVLQVLILICYTSFANETLFREARTLQREGKYEEAIGAFKSYLVQPMDEDGVTAHEVAMYTEALVQLMNTFQSKGEPEACISTLQEVYSASPALQNQYLRDYNSVMG